MERKKRLKEAETEGRRREKYRDKKKGSQREERQRERYILLSL